MDRYKRLLISLRKTMQPLKRGLALAHLPAFIRYDARVGALVPEDREAEQQAQALGVVLKEYVIDDDWDPGQEGMDG